MILLYGGFSVKTALRPVGFEVLTAVGTKMAVFCFKTV
jgi:hypothetical protein